MATICLLQQEDVKYGGVCLECWKLHGAAHPQGEAEWKKIPKLLPETGI